MSHGNLPLNTMDSAGSEISTTLSGREYFLPDSSVLTETEHTTDNSPSRSLDCPKCGLRNPHADELISLREQVITDPLTGLYNHRYFRTQLELELQRTLRTSVPTSLMMVDLDHFKQVNDQYGHETGNLVLKTTARRICESTRQLDIQCRYGGEEFVVILPSTGILLASQVAERLRMELEVTELTLEDGSSLKVTASIGLAEADHRASATPEKLITLADEQLYRAKAQGRNQVCRASNTEEVEAAVSFDEKDAIQGLFGDPE